MSERQITTDPNEPRNIREDLESMKPVIKAHIISQDRVQATNVVSTDEERAFASAGALEPPFDPQTLCVLFGHSNSLRQNIDAYEVNIDGFGHRFEPVINLDSDDANEQIRDALFLDRISDLETDDADDDAMDSLAEQYMPSDSDVEKRKKSLVAQIRLEKAKLQNFFDFCCMNVSFVKLRKQTRQDIEVTGNGYWEVLRNGRDEVAQFTYMPAFSMRLVPLDPDAIPVKQKVRVSPFTFKTMEMRRRFRRYVQVFQDDVIFFKEFGDPRVISKKDGRVITEEEKDDFDAQTEAGADGPATEVWHWFLHNPESAYGTPRWMGNLLSVLGSRQSEEVNFLYFDNKGVPPLALLISGGKLSTQSVDRVSDFIENNIKGRKNFHSIMVIEAEAASSKATADSAGKIRIDLKPLTAAQHNDALFQKYDERNIDKVGMAFRLPRMLRGDIRDFNRSTADAALAFAEMQVFQPERQDFDFSVNRQLLLNEMGIRFWRFVSNAPVTRDPEVVAKMIKDLMNANAFTAIDVRPLLEEVFNREFRTLQADWAKQPVPLTLAGIPLDGDAGKGDMTGGDLAGAGRRAPSQDSSRMDGPFRGRRRRRKSEIDEILEDLSLDEQVTFMLKLRERLEKAEVARAEEEHLAARTDAAALAAKSKDV